MATPGDSSLTVPHGEKDGLRRSRLAASRVSFDNLVALANYEDRIRQRAVYAKKMVWRDKGEPAKELTSIPDVTEHAIRGALRALAVGFWMRGSLNLVLALIRIRRVRPDRRLNVLRKALFGTDSLRSAAMLGSFVAIYKFLLNALPILFPTSSQPRQSMFVLPKTPGAETPPKGTAMSYIDSDIAPAPSSHDSPPVDAELPAPQGKLSLQAEAHQVWIRKRTRRWQAVLSGAIAGAVAISFEKKSRRLGVAQQMFVRGLQGSWNAYATKHKINFPHGDVIVFSLSCAYIMYSYLMAPERLDRGYNNWIQQASHIPAETVLINRSLVRNGKFDLAPLDKIIARDDVTEKNLAELLLIRDKATQPIPDYGVRYSQCATVHPMLDSCTQVPMHRFLTVAKWMFPVYAALTFVPMLVFRTKSFVKSPASMLLKGLLGTLRSCAFLGAFVTYYQTYYCFKHWVHSLLVKYTNIPHAAADVLIGKASFWFGGIIAGLSLFIEKQHRRAELAMYVLPKGLETLWITAQSNGYAFNTGNWGDIILTAFGMGMIMSTYQNDPHHLSNFVRKIVYQLVGPN